MLSEKRYPELDALRGIAVLMMVAYHAAFDLNYFYNWNISVLEGGWWLFARATATLFLLVMGICFMISWERASSPRRRVMLSGVTQSERSESKRNGDEAQRRRSAQHDTQQFHNVYPKYLKRGLTIFTGGMLISLVTWFVAPDAFVKFGILHLIGVSALLQPLFARFKKWNALLGILLFVIGKFLATLSTPSMFLFPLGITYPGFASLDYYPLFPWFGVILIGMAIGSAFYVPLRKSNFERLDRLPYPQWLLWTGRRALLLYFLHQPILLLLLRIFLGKPV